MQKIVFHGGIHKTGTSFIQVALSESRRELREKFEIHYPRLLDETHHHQFVSRVRESVDSGKDLLSKIANQSKDDTVLLLSSEELANDAQSQEMVDRYRRVFAGATVEFVFFLRPQYELIESVYSQIVKDFYCGPISAGIPYLMNFERRFRFLEAAFPGKVRFYPYYSGIDLWPLARDAFGMDASVVAPDSRVNTGMPRRKTLYLSGLRKPSNPVFRSQLVSAVAHSEAIEDDGGKGLMPPPMKRQFHASMDESNSAFFKRNGIKGAAEFWKGWSVPDESQWNPPAPISISEQYEMSSEIWKHARRWNSD
jgi:hypothetical protein